MAAIFPKSSDIILKVLGAVIGLGAVATIGAYTYYSYPTVIDTGYQPVQPVPYSHKLHAGQLGLNCFYCHYTVYRAPSRPSRAPRSAWAATRRLRTRARGWSRYGRSFETGEPIPWVKIHALPDYVYFNHRAHITCGRELRELPRPDRPDGGSPPGEAAQYGLVPGLPPRPGAQHPAGRSGDASWTGCRTAIRARSATRSSRRSI